MKDRIPRLDLVLECVSRVGASSTSNIGSRTFWGILGRYTLNITKVALMGSPLNWAKAGARVQSRALRAAFTQSPELT